MRGNNRQAGKMLVPLLAVLAVIAMAVAAAAAFVLMQERDKRQAKERELQLALAENDDLKARLEEVRQIKSRMEEELTRVRADLAQSKEQLAKSAEAQQTLARSVEDREREITRMTKELDQTRNDQKGIATQLAQLQTERDAMKQQLADLDRAKGELESKVMELSGEQPTVELDKVVVSNPGQAVATGNVTPLPVSATSSSKPNGRVVVINREYDFIVMNLGKNHGVSVGQEFQIVRGSEVLGKVRVEKVYDELSAAALLPGSQKESIKDGDDGDTVRAL